jgi:hypothetical protein
MFEIIKLFIEQVFRALDIKSLLESHKRAKLAKIGADLFALYSTLNSIYTCGNRILEEIDDIVPRSAETGGGTRYRYAGRLRSLLEEQSNNIVDFSQAFTRLARVIDVLHPDIAYRMSLFITPKKNIVGFLLANMSGVNAEKGSFLFGAATEGNLISLLEKTPEHRSADNLSLFYDDMRLGQAIESAQDVRETIALVDHLSDQSLIILAEYMKTRKPREQLETLRPILADLHATIAKSFEVKDILLKVGDERARKHNLNWFP